MIVSSTLFVVYLILLLLIIRKVAFFCICKQHRNAPFLAFGLKLFFSLFVWAVYSYYYTDRNNADIFKFFDDAQLLFEATEGNLYARLKIISGLYHTNEIGLELFDQTSFWDSKNSFFLNDNRTMIRVHFILHFISGGFYPIHALFFAFISFIGSIGIFKFLQTLTKTPFKILFFIVFLSPSVLFWTSAPFKEGYLLFSLGVFLYGVRQFYCDKQFSSLCFLIIGFLLLLSLKIYILIALLPGVTYLIVSKKQTAFKTLLIRFLAVHLLVGIAILQSHKDLVNQLMLRQNDFKILAKTVKANSYIKISAFENIYQLVKTIPEALYNVIIHPVHPPSWSIFNIISHVEHLFFLLCLLAPIFYWKKVKPTDFKIILFTSSFLLFTFSLIGLTTPVLGALVRYKAPLIPFYLILISTFVDYSKINLSLK